MSKSFGRVQALKHMFLMDVPLANLDFKLRVEMQAELKRLQREVDTKFFPMY